MRLLILLILFSFSSFAQEITLYVNSPATKDITEKRWQPTIDLLNKNIPEYHFKLLPIKPSEVGKIQNLLDQKKIDFLITQPAITTVLQHTNHISIMLTMVTKYKMDRFGSVFLVKKDSKISSLQDIKGKSVAAVAPLSFGGWLAGYRDLYDLGIDPLKEGRVTFMNGSHKKVIENVLVGNFDVGVVKTGMLEQLSEARLLDLNQIKVLNDRNIYPVKVSSTLYPEWSLSKSKHVDNHLANRVFKEFNSIKHTSLAAQKGGYYHWHLPQSHAEVDAIFKEFRLGHYKDLPKYDMTFVIILVSISVLVTIIVAIFITLYLKNRYLRTLKEELENELKDKEDMLIFQSRNAAIGEMIGMIAHQWRQPLSIVAIGVNNILLDYELGEIDQKEMEKNLHSILNETQKLSKTIDDFKHFFSLSEKNKSKTLEEMIDNISSLLSDSFKNEDINFTIHAEGLWQKDIFPNELQQVILNILRNSHEAFIERDVQNKEITISIEKNKKTHIIIEDNAGGIPHDILLKIFEPYYTTKKELNGAGLGLYVAKSIIENILEGEIHAVNTDKGVKFILLF